MAQKHSILFRINYLQTHFLCFLLSFATAPPPPQTIVPLICQDVMAEWHPNHPQLLHTPKMAPTLDGDGRMVLFLKLVPYSVLTFFFSPLHSLAFLHSPSLDLQDL